MPDRGPGCGIHRSSGLPRPRAYGRANERFGDADPSWTEIMAAALCNALGARDDGLAVCVAGGPGQVGAAASGGGQLEGAAVALCAAAHAGKAAAASGRTEAAAGVGDAEGDVAVLERQGDADGGGVGVSCAVGQGFTGNGQDVVGQRLARAWAQRAGEVTATVKPSCAACSSMISMSRAGRPAATRRGCWSPKMLVRIFLMTSSRVSI